MGYFVLRTLSPPSSFESTLLQPFVTLWAHHLCQPPVSKSDRQTFLQSRVFHNTLSLQRNSICESLTNRRAQVFQSYFQIRKFYGRLLSYVPCSIIKGVSSIFFLYLLLFVIYNSKLLRHHIYDKCLRTFSTDKDIGRDSAEGFQTGGSQFPLPCLKAHFCPTDMCHCQTILLSVGMSQ